jgi:signal-transduction protein with cAMP-binding, CBS, and nucleotidyltransferase domain
VGRLDDAGRFGQLPPDLVDPLREGFEVAQRVRLEQHLDALRQGAPLDNGVDLERLSAWDETLLKEVFRAVKEAQSALEARFHAGHGR